MVQELTAKEMENRCQMFTSLKTADMTGAMRVLKTHYPDVREEDGSLRIYDVNDSEAIVDLLMKNGYVVSEIRKNRIGLEEYYIELMSKKEGA